MQLEKPIKLSVIVPIFNEIATVAEVLQILSELRIEGVEVELILVESNSRDGSREAVLSFADDHKAVVLLEDQPKGKGHAVRAGLQRASGQIVLIQDADLEYDVADYHKLLEPIISGETTFVLGTRTQQGWRVRTMPGEKFASVTMNIGHWILTGFFNMLYRTKLRDPFTMYKVVLLEAVKPLEFECDRFDFDWELVAKLVRTGHKPIEVPVSYSARGFTSGKKVRPFRDPLQWIWAALKYRIVRIESDGTKETFFRKD